MDFDLSFPEDAHKNNGILVSVDRFSKRYHFAAANGSISAHGCARVFIDTVFRLHGLPRELDSDRYSRFTAEFWQSVFRPLGTRLKMSTSDHPVTYDADVDQVDIEEYGHLNNSDDAIIESDDDDDIFSIANDYSSEGDVRCSSSVRTVGHSYQEVGRRCGRRSTKCRQVCAS